MKRCFPKNRIPTPRPWDHRGLRTHPRVISRRPAVKQLSNTELLEIIRQDKQQCTSPITVQTNPPGLDSQDRNIPSQTAPFTATYISRLPQSPLTDQSLVAARLRHRAVKPRPSKNLSPFQLKLQKNLFAIALATPPRLCILTGLRLPSYFQIPFGLATHPKTGAPWHLPMLPTKALSEPGDDQISSVTFRADVPCAAQSKDASNALNPPVRTLSSTHFLASRQVLAHVSGLTPSKYNKLMPYLWKQDPSIKISDIVWREDMDIFVLEILQKNVSRTLSYLASRPAAYIAPCKNYDSINNHDQVAAVLWLNRNADSSVNDQPAFRSAISSGVRETGPPPYSMHYYKTHYIPCYNLAALLGPIQFSALQHSRPNHYSDHFAVIKLKRGTVKVQLELWKLLGYIVQDDRR